ncbi:winged helix-turn-helix transcriptional regulator [Bacillus shivajii]|uniref:helix-turn-helix transcriptional regulator n=1 Tax=Bacillus shivajii TaxID=1983719 RepID=UPI001CFA17A8|nr:winged helix-turn-helix transcriptional regulator [Bacillus shivajii]UCZ52545.1 winged helix-turn-helix transcriptional regulator [Bacillus shivajii]
MVYKTASTRDQILNLLKKKKQLTVAIIAEQLNITEMAVRRHLNTLERDEIVETTLLRQAMGRPTNVYQLSTKGQEMLFPRDYGNFSVDLLLEIEQMDGPEKVRELFDRRKDKIQKRFEKRLIFGSFDENVYELGKMQNEQGYMTEVIKEDDGSFILKEYNCPLAEVAKQFPAICEAELEMFKDLLQTEHVQCQMCMATGHEPHCYYKIKKSDKTYSSLL